LGDLDMEQDRLIVVPHSAPREGWEEAFAAAGTSAGDELLLNFPNEFDWKEWLDE
jgi:hypothetical protein